MNEDKNMTIGDLARLMQNEFVGVNKRLDGHDEMFAGLNQRLDGHDKMFAGLNQRLDGHDKMFAGLNQRLGGLEADVKFIKDNANELFTKLDEFYHYIAIQNRSLICWRNK
jgi:CII-binding regulator of phage lambda lysogenization HflD